MTLLDFELSNLIRDLDEDKLESAYEEAQAIFERAIEKVKKAKEEIRKYNDMITPEIMSAVDHILHMYCTQGVLRVRSELKQLLPEFCVWMDDPGYYSVKIYRKHMTKDAFLVAALYSDLQEKQDKYTYKRQARNIRNFLKRVDLRKDEENEYLVW